MDEAGKKKNKDNQEKEEEKMVIETGENETDDKKLIQFKFRDLGHTQHWSEKASDSMTERDWRIFREVNIYLSISIVIYFIYRIMILSLKVEEFQNLCEIGMRLLCQ